MDSRLKIISKKAIWGLTAVSLSAGLAFAADNDGPIVHDYSGSGAAEYKAPDGETAGNGPQESSDDSASADGQLYTVRCTKGQTGCKAGHDVIVGYETFGGNCARCHGENGEGSTFAPSLVNSIQGGLNQGAFTAAVAGGLQKKDTTTGTYRVMPAWANNPTVMNNVSQIWAYLKARADGKLPGGRPQPMDKNSG